MTVWRDVQAAGLALRRRSLPEGRMQVLGADETWVRVRDRPVCLGFTVDAQTGDTLGVELPVDQDAAAFLRRLKRLPGQEAVKEAVREFPSWGERALRELAKALWRHTPWRTFLPQMVARFPFPVRAIQTDGGSEFLGAFGPAAQQLGVVHSWNRPNYPQGNGRVERAFRTDEEEFYQVGEMPAALGGPEAALLAWNWVHETVRPHQALGYLTPEEFYQRWKEGLSDIY